MANASSSDPPYHDVKSSRKIRLLLVLPKVASGLSVKEVQRHLGRTFHLTLVGSSCLAGSNFLLKRNSVLSVIGRRAQFVPKTRSPGV